MPLLNEPCSFDLLIYTNKTAAVPKKWDDSDPRYIMNSQEVKLRRFTTSVSRCKFLLDVMNRIRLVRGSSVFVADKVSQSRVDGHLQGGGRMGAVDFPH